MHLNIDVRLRDLILTETLIMKLDIYARTYYRIMLGIKQSRDHVTNQNLNQLTGQDNPRAPT